MARRRRCARRASRRRADRRNSWRSSSAARRRHGSVVGIENTCPDANRDRDYAGVCGERATSGRTIQQHPATIAGDAIGADAAAVRHARQRDERLIDQPRAGLAVDIGDDAEAAAVVLECRIVQTLFAVTHVGDFRADRRAPTSIGTQGLSVSEGSCLSPTHYNTFAASRQSSIDV
jgi:hypothetical protein